LSVAQQGGDVQLKALNAKLSSAEASARQAQEQVVTLSNEIAGACHAIYK